ncbi:MAG TPA: hypothetical protein V6C85_24870 [Allocoleopsis sp.]
MRLPCSDKKSLTNYVKFCIEIQHFCWKHRGNVELYFKHRYQEFNYRIGSLTEYFRFTDVEPVWEDLSQMQPKVLEPVELDVLSGDLASLCL